MTHHVPSRAVATSLAALAAVLVSCGPGDDGTGGDGADAFRKPSTTVLPHVGGRTADAWAARLASGDASERYEATQALARLGPSAAEYANDVAARLVDPSPDVRWGALDALARFGPAEPAVATAVVARLRDEHPGVARAAARAAGNLGAAAAAPLAALLADPDARVRLEVALALGRLGAGAGAAVPDLERVVRLDEEAWDVQEAAARTLGEIGAASLPALRRVLEDPRPEVATLAARALGALAADAAPAVEDLGRTLRRKGEPRFAAAEALVAVGEAARATLEAATHDEDEAVAATAAAALARIPVR